MDPIDIARQANHQFFSAEKTPPAPLPVVIHTVDVDGEYVVIDYTGTDGARDIRAFPYEGAPNADPLSLDNEQFYVNAILGI
jgi:hypothetical protein